jgi:hypothetical protein
VEEQEPFSSRGQSTGVQLAASTPPRIDHTRTSAARSFACPVAAAAIHDHHFDALVDPD